MLKPVQTHIDSLSLNSRHFAEMTEDQAVKQLKNDGFTKDDAWAKKAYKEMVADVKKADKLAEEEVKP